MKKGLINNFDTLIPGIFYFKIFLIFSYSIISNLQWMQNEKLLYCFFLIIGLWISCSHYSCFSISRDDSQLHDITFVFSQPGFSCTYFLLKYKSSQSFKKSQFHCTIMWASRKKILLHENAFITSNDLFKMKLVLLKTHYVRLAYVTILLLPNVMELR